MRKWLAENISLVLTGATLAIFILVPYLGETKFLVHDFLNSNVVWYKLLKISGLLFGSSVESIDSLMTGVPRGCFPSELNGTNLLFQTLPLNMALFANHLMIHLVAFVGMLILLKETVRYQNREMSPTLSVLIHLMALSFALLPFWTPASLSVAGQPLVLYAFLRLYQHSKDWKAWLIVIVLPFFSTFIFSTFFLLIEVFVFWSILSLVNRKINKSVLLGLIVLGAFSVLSEYRLFYMQLVEQMESQRIPEQSHSTLNLFGFIGVSLKLFFQGQYHAHVHSFPVILAMVLGLAFVQNDKRSVLYLGVGLAIQFAFVSTLNLRDWDLVTAILPKESVLNTLQLRFYTLLPVFWHLTVFLLLLNIKVRLKTPVYKVSQGLLVVLICLRIFNVGITDYQGSAYADNRFYSTFFNSSNQYQSIDRYYRTSFFDELKSRLPPEYLMEQDKIACFNIEPQVAQMNGFKTLGGYFPYYPMESKRRFMSYVEKEYEKNNKSYLTQLKRWGAQCYFKFEEHEECAQPQFDYDAMVRDGTKLVLSRSEICDDALIEFTQILDADRNQLFRLYRIDVKLNSDEY